MESNLDEVYYQKYQQYKHKYTELKQLKNNNLQGGFFGWFNNKNEAETRMAYNTTSSNSSVNTRSNDNDVDTDGEYLVFYIEDEGELSDENLEKYKKFVQDNYDVENKTGIPFSSINEFNILFNEKAYIVTKTGNKISYSMITNNVEPDFYNKLEQVKSSFYIDKNESDPIIQNLSNNCFTSYITNVIKQLDDSIQLTNNEEVKKNLERLKLDFSTKSTTDMEKQNFYKGYTDFKTTLIKTLDTDKYLKYNKFEYEKGDYRFMKAYSEKFFNEFIDKIKDNNKQKDTDIKLNMIIKIRKTDKDYTFGEYVNKNSITITPMYGKIVAALTKRRYDRIKDNIVDTIAPK
jgi:hypothetical protein